MIDKKEIDAGLDADKALADIFWDTMYAHLCRYQCGHITIVELFHEWERLLGLTGDEPLKQEEIK
ncbi:MAG TPA: hypothetical protein VNG51_23165 [Ktedonobacteraceae bacterium]|nr:hypothetical protein [Ktedonobacteraceae bacterium]